MKLMQFVSTAAAMARGLTTLASIVAVVSGSSGCSTAAREPSSEGEPAVASTQQAQTAGTTCESTAYDAGGTTRCCFKTAQGKRCTFEIKRGGVVAPAIPPIDMRSAIVNTSSSYEGWGWSKAFAADGITSSNAAKRGFSSFDNASMNHKEWVELWLPTSATFSKLVLHPRADETNVGDGFPTDFKFQVWTGEAWLDRVVQTGYPHPGGAPQAFTWGSSDRTNGIRIEATKLRPANSLYYLQLAEIELFP